jgi:hypothetical protein
MRQNKRRKPPTGAGGKATMVATYMPCGAATHYGSRRPPAAGSSPVLALTAIAGVIALGTVA